MIAKRCDLLGAIPSSFARLADYLTNHQGNECRVGDVALTNVLSEGYDFALAEIQATQTLNTRAKGDKTYHLMVSFREGENPSPGVLKEIEQKIADGLGLGEHQRLSVLHRDTDNLHFHLAINKIHPQKLTMHEPYYDKKKLAKLCKNLEQEYGLQIDNHEAKKTVSQANAQNMERAGGMESLIGWTQRECGEALKKASSWEEFHQVLSEHGLALQERGRGFVITDGKTTIKSSSVARELSRGGLEGRLGEYQSHSREKISPKNEYKRQPISKGADSRSLWNAYQAARKDLWAARRAELKQEREKRDKTIASARKGYALQKFFMRFVKNRFMKTAMRHAFSSSKERRIQKAREEYEKKKNELPSGQMSWMDWLKAEAKAGNAEAIKFLQSRREKPVEGNYFSGQVHETQAGQTPEAVTTKGTYIYSKELRETASEVKVSGTGPESLLNGLLLAEKKFAGIIQVNGPSEFKENVIDVAVKNKLEIQFADMSLEAERKRRVTEHNHIEAATKYIENRNLLKVKVSDITEHKLFEAQDAGLKTYAGIRTQGGFSLALLKDEKSKITSVLPVSEGAAKQLRGIKIGSPVMVDQKGRMSPTGPQKASRRKGR